jgi:hypothetical protein
MSAAPRLVANQASPAEIIAELDAIGRGRAPDPVESLLLERSILLADGKRIPHGLTRALARHGIKRDMRMHRGRNLNRR